MKRLFLFFLVIFFSAGLATPARAQSGAQVHTETTVAADGSCSVIVTATLIFDKAVENPVFPIPLEAMDIALNDGPATSYTATNSRMVSLKKITGGNPGSHTITLSYRLPAVVGSIEEDKGLFLTLNLLSGLAYPIDSFEATVRLPGAITETPSFTSGYYQQNINSLLDSRVVGNSITIKTTDELKDHETLTLTLPVKAEMFPQPARNVQVLSLMDLLLVLSIAAAIAFYVFVLWPARPHRRPRPAAPDGISAGSLPQWFTGGKIDFSMLIVTWAQLGYLRIQVTKSGHVKLHKRMEMGNERSAAENRCYRELFGRRRTLDCGSEHFVQQRRMAAGQFRRPAEVYRSSLPLGFIFRGICAMSAVIGGITIADGLTATAFVQFLLICGIAAMAFAVQSAGGCLWLRRKLPAWIGLGCALIWLSLGLQAEEGVRTVLLILFQFLAGIAAAWGGKRTELSRQTLQQILGLRKFIRGATKQELQQLLKSNPNYFHEIAPYALSMGLDMTFARRFARLRMPDCPYLIREGKQTLAATEWAALLRTAVRSLDGGIRFKR